MSKLLMLCAALALTLTALPTPADAKKKRAHVIVRAPVEHERLVRNAAGWDPICSYERSYGGYCEPGRVPARKGYYGGRYFSPVYYGRVPSLYESMASPMFPFR